MTAPKKVNVNRLQQQSRETLAQMDLVGHLQRTIAILTSGFKPIYLQPRKNTTAKQLSDDLSSTIPIEWEPLSREDISRFNLLLRTLTSALTKVLPDLKAVEINDTSESKKTLSDLELAQRIAGVLGTEIPTTTLPEHLQTKPEWLN